MVVQYPIKRWDPVQFSSSKLAIFPMIYIEPDAEFISYIRKNNYKITVGIEGTGKSYDGRKLRGTVDRSSVTPSCRPNYYVKTGLYVITLEAPWEGYPLPTSLGRIELLDMDGLPAGSPQQPPPIKDTPPTKAGAPAVSPTHSPTHKGLNLPWILGILGGIGAILITLILLSNRKSSHG